MSIKHLWLAAASLPITAGLASGDTLDLVRTAVANGVTVQADDTDKGTMGLYFRFDAGANFLGNANIKNVSLQGTSMPTGTPGISNAGIKFNPGLDTAVSFGYELGDWLSIELQTGLAWNGINGIYGNWLIPNGISGTGEQLIVDRNISGGNGHLYQIPMMVNLNFDIPLSTPDSERWPFIGHTAYLTLSVGVGAEYAHLNITDMYFPGGGGTGLATMRAELDNGAWAFAYQVGANLRMELAQNMDLGVYFRFRGTSSFDFGNPTFDAPGVNSPRGFEISSLLNYAVGMNFRIEF
ncbi:MAG: hypothetical protein MK085_06730 [Phycisphaerales bacterium]|nr:hypothetical protein [Phycisphaerales bacterium]